MKGDQVQPTLNSQVHPKGPTPKDWNFEVLTKMVVIQKQEIASEEWLTHTQGIEEDPSSENKGCTPNNRKD